MMEIGRKDVIREQTLSTMKKPAAKTAKKGTKRAKVKKATATGKSKTTKTTTKSSPTKTVKNTKKT